MPTRRKHNEWFRTVSLGNRKSCPTCKAKLGQGESIWSWGEYVNAKWRTVTHFCSQCFEKEVKEKLCAHRGSCGCDIELQTRWEIRPDWLTIDEGSKV